MAGTIVTPMTHASHVVAISDHLSYIVSLKTGCREYGHPVSCVLGKTIWAGLEWRGVLHKMEHLKSQLLPEAISEGCMFYKRTVMDNGVEIITQKMSDVRSVTLGMWFAIGSRDERADEAGMSHFMEHMMFKGTGTYTAAQISENFESLGAELNAFTSKEYTCYYSRFVDEKLSSAIKMLSDMVVNSVFAQEEIDREREVVIEEIARSEDTPEDYVYDLFGNAILPEHPLGLPIIGTRDSVSGFDHSDCVSYHNRHYLSGNLTVVAVGNVDHDSFVELCSSSLPDIPSGPRTKRPEHIIKQGKAFAFDKKDTKQAHIIYGMPSIPANDPKRFAMALLDLAIGGGMSSRLFQEVREKRGLVYSIYSTTSSYIGTGYSGIYAGTRPSNIEEVVGIIRDELDVAKQEGITQEELQRVKELAKGQLTLDSEGTRSNMFRLGKNACTRCDILSLDELLDAYDDVSLDDVNELAARIYSNKPTLAIISPYESSRLEKMLF